MRHGLPSRRAPPDRGIATTVLAAACALCASWAIFARWPPVRIHRENLDVLAALEPGVPAVVLAGETRSALSPDDMYYVMARASHAPSPQRPPSRDVEARLSVVSLLESVPGANAVRGEDGREVLRYARADGRTVVVLRYGPP